MTNYVVTVLANGQWRTPQGDDKPQSYTERREIGSAAKHAAEQGYGRIMVTITRDGKATYVPMHT